MPEIRVLKKNLEAKFAVPNHVLNYKFIGQRCQITRASLLLEQTLISTSKKRALGGHLTKCQIFREHKIQENSLIKHTRPTVLIFPEIKIY